MANTYRNFLEIGLIYNERRYNFSDYLVAPQKVSNKFSPFFFFDEKETKNQGFILIPTIYVGINHCKINKWLAPIY